MKKFYRRIFFILIFIICIGSILIYFNSNKSKDIIVNGGADNDGGFSYNADGTVTLGQGMVANGFYDFNTNKIIDQGTLLEPLDGKISGRISFRQNITGERNYLLIIMLDYVQQQFIVDNVTCSTYSFTLNGEANTSIYIEVPLLDVNSREFQYMIVCEPDITDLSIENSNEWNKLLMTKEFYTWRLPLFDTLGNDPLFEYDYTYNIINTLENQIGDTINLAKTHQNISVLPACKSSENLELIMGNGSKDETNYVLVAFMGWKQIPFEDGSMTKFVSVPPETSIYYGLKAPRVESDIPYQIFAFPKPFNNEFKFSSPPTSTLRTIIKPFED